MYVTTFGNQRRRHACGQLHEGVPIVPCRYGTSLADWSADGAWHAYAAHNAVVLLRPGERRIAHMLSGHTNRRAIVIRVIKEAIARGGARLNVDLALMLVVLQSLLACGLHQSPCF